MQVREIGRADRHQAVGEAGVLHFPEARRGRARESDRRRDRRFDERRDALIGRRRQRRLRVDVERAPVDRAVDLRRRERHLVLRIRRQSRADRQRVFQPRRIPRIVGRPGRLAVHRVVPGEPGRGRLSAPSADRRRRCSGPDRRRAAPRPTSAAAPRAAARPAPARPSTACTATVRIVDERGAAGVERLQRELRRRTPADSSSTAPAVPACAGSAARPRRRTSACGRRSRRRRACGRRSTSTSSGVRDGIVGLRGNRRPGRRRPASAARREAPA